MTAVAVVPVKRLDLGKSRLAETLSPAEREALTLAMLGDVLEALAGVPQLARRIVVTPDPAVGEAARKLGAEAWVLDVPGLNPSLDAAARRVVDEGIEAWVVILGDVAAADPADLGALFDALTAQGGRGSVLAAARDGGTAALLRCPPTALPNRFGADSAAAHEAEAQQSALPFTRLVLPSLSFDLDDRDDALALLARDGGAARTRALLETALPGATTEPRP